MTPNVAQQSRPFAPQFGSPNFVASPFEPIPSQRKPERPQLIPFRGSSGHHASPSEITSTLRAFPVEQRIYRAGSLGGALNRSPYHDPAEHMLRRKTPNGTLAAGYDGSPVQWSSKPPALKHLLLPAADTSNQQGPPSRAAMEDDTFRLRSSSLGGWHQQQTPQFGSISQRSGQRMNSDPGSWAYPPSMNTPNDVLGHFTLQSQPQTYYPNNGMQLQIPTVLQPSYQQPPGPTASNDAGLYGPYWPDGNFLPYRPAAIRHLAQHPQPHYINFDLNTSYGSYQGPGTYAVEQISAPYGNQQLSFNVDSAQNPSGVSFSSLPRQPELDSFIRPAYLHVNIPNHVSNLSATGDGSRTPTATSSNRNSPHFNEKTLLWAHTIYVDLLAFLHQSEKESRQSKQANGVKTFSKNNIYPKPPRQPTLSFGSTDRTTIYSSSRKESNAISPRNQIGDPPLSQLRSNSISGSDWKHGTSMYETRYSRPTQDMPHYVTPHRTIPNSNNSPIGKAKDALDMLTTLCEQSSRTWIDGMLLGGCLAYGLEEYQKALDWYSKIIALDSTHVEAISNLAATLLCLNRREEAEQHWLQSVKLRPSYFEAVEHLIGLLCNDHRGTEAINIIDFVERSLRIKKQNDFSDWFSETSSNDDRSSTSSISTVSDRMVVDFESEERCFRSPLRESDDGQAPGFGSSGFSVPGTDNGRILALIHAKGNMLYALGDVEGASKAFEDSVLISAGRGFHEIQGLIKRVVAVLTIDGFTALHTDVRATVATALTTSSPLLLPPNKALQTAKLVFTKNGELPGLRYVSEGLAKKAAVSTTSNSLLSLAKIFQDAMSNSSSAQKISRMPTGVGDILALYYLSLSLQPSPSTANNVGILLASVPPSASYRSSAREAAEPVLPGMVPGSGVALALAYYNYGLVLDSKHAHLYTNLGSLMKDIGQLNAAIKMYEMAVKYDGTFDIALANLANAVKDQGNTSDAIVYYRRAVAASPDFSEAVCGLANALNSVCDWTGRGGVVLDGGRQDRWHVTETGMIMSSKGITEGGGWMKRVVDIVKKQLSDGESWGRKVLFEGLAMYYLMQQLEIADNGGRWEKEKERSMRTTLTSWVGKSWEGARILRIIERANKRAMHRWYQDKYVKMLDFLSAESYSRPKVPGHLSIPTSPTVLPFHTFTCPLSAKDIRRISQRNAYRISCSTLKSPWIQDIVFRPPPPPKPRLNIGYVSSDFNNHPLAHLMQSVFGMHNPRRAKAICYATTPSDGSVHRKQIEDEAPVFMDVSSWAPDRLVQQIVKDEIHILVNLNGYTRGARNEIFAARPAPIQMSFMGFAGTLGAEWCDYILADETAIPPSTLRPWRRNIDLEDQLLDQQSMEEEDWIYSENIIFCRDTFFCCDHAQSEPKENRLTWEDEQAKRWAMRKELFPSLSDDAIILGNFNQLYKIEPTVFRTWLRILDRVPKAILWLLRFPDLGESNLKRYAREWAGESVASRIWFTDVAPKHQHISRARVCDLFLDTPECNAHTTAADVLWSSTPLLTLPRYEYKMCSRMAASILQGALPKNAEGFQAAEELIANDDDQYEDFAIKLASLFSYKVNAKGVGVGTGRLGEMRKLLYDSRWTCALFDTKRWVSDLEDAYDEAWRRWVAGEGGDIYL
ncbi:glycosyltransferase family 41 protein [Calycina marina]|uniref:protein O-GlcNAc transferase n=1 Tax=Calycina marina TaxID=1763456 RepID=A0A9P8CEV6_9HELO|nr:glycosyltransferase family 41 protein [Calycina marina]